MRIKINDIVEMTRGRKFVVIGISKTHIDLMPKRQFDAGKKPIEVGFTSWNRRPGAIHPGFFDCLVSVNGI